VNILYVTQWYGSSGGGGEVVFHNLASGMAKRGHRVDVVCAKTATPVEHSDEDVTIHSIEPALELPPPSLRQNARFIINAIKKGTYIVKQKNIEVIHANNLASVIAGSILSKIKRKPLVISIHDIFSTSSPEHWKNWIAQDPKISRTTSFIAPLVEKITVKTPSSMIHTVSDTTREDLIRFGAKAGKIQVIPNGLNLNNYDHCSTRNASYQNLILFIGRLVFYKNMDVVIRSFIDVVKNVRDVRLVIVGDGPMLSKWQKMSTNLGLNNSIIFTGHASEDKKIGLLKSCSALVLPSFVEGFGLVILESFAMKKPVLVANVKPLSEIVSDGIDGFVLPVDDPIEWSKKIEYLLTNKHICMRMGEEGRRKLEQKYDIEYILRDMEYLYLSLLERKPY
jgi:glycosyltransferase involved in cell wall biosynthesis